MIRAVVTDIEGTTSALSFVKDVLFPYARERLPDFVREHRDDAEVTALLDEVRALTGSELDIEDIIVLLRHWIDEDRKATPLKTLQGMIWEAGYEQGELRGHVYPDAVEALRAWHEAGLTLAVFSSGSVHAQQLLFGHTDYGDLTPLFSDYFDTRVGAKNAAGSYRQIVNQLALPAGAVLFLSDVEAELDAAREAGLHTGWLVREGEPDPDAAHRQYPDFRAIELEAVDA